MTCREESQISDGTRSRTEILPLVCVLIGKALKVGPFAPSPFLAMHFLPSSALESNAAVIYLKMCPRTEIRSAKCHTPCTRGSCRAPSLHQPERKFPAGKLKHTAAPYPFINLLISSRIKKRS